MTVAAPQTPLEKRSERFAQMVFGRIVEDLRVLLGQPLNLLECGPVLAGWPQLQEHFAPLGTRIEAGGASMGEERFAFTLDQRASYLLPGTLLMFPDPVLVDLIRGGVFNEDLQDALAEIGNNLVGSLKRCLEPLGAGEDMVQGETVWKPDLLAGIDTEQPHLRALFGYRRTKLLLLLSLPPFLVARFDRR